MLLKAYMILYFQPTTHAKNFLKNITTNANGFEFKMKQVQLTSLMPSFCLKWGFYAGAAWSFCIGMTSHILKVGNH